MRRYFKALRRDVRQRGVWLSADEARIVAAAVQRPRTPTVTEPGGDVIVKFLRRVEEMR
jgi:hypothetical protein